MIANGALALPGDFGSLQRHRKNLLLVQPIAIDAGKHAHGPDRPAQQAGSNAQQCGKFVRAPVRDVANGKPPDKHAAQDGGTKARKFEA